MRPETHGSIDTLKVLSTMVVKCYRACLQVCSHFTERIFSAYKSMNKADTENIKISQLAILSISDESHGKYSDAGLRVLRGPIV